MLLFLLFAAFVTNGLQILRPIESQYPLIARVGASYSWKLSPDTFGSDNGQATPNGTIYMAHSLPSWLNFDANTLSFTGSAPPSSEPGSFPITVTASYLSSKVSDTFDLLLSSAPEPVLSFPLSQQITSHSAALSPAFLVNSPSALPTFCFTTMATDGKIGLRIPPMWGFSFGFRGDTFSPWPLVHSAALTNGEELPEWIRYNSRTYTFDGIAPDVESLGIEISYMASDEEGYSTRAKDNFWLIVAAHELKLRNAEVGVVRNVTANNEFEMALLDGEEGDPFAGEVLWDTGPLPLWAIRSVLVVRGFFAQVLLESPHTVTL